MVARRGLNATLLYPSGGKARAFRVRCTQITHGTELVSQESNSRTQRALYPMKQVPSQFTMTVVLVGYTEHMAFSNWLSAYAMVALTPDRGGGYPVMTVSVPARHFHRTGVPTVGVEYGDHVGSMVFNRTIVFETATEPWDAKRPRYSQYEAPDNSIAYRENQYFYPSGVQLTGDQKPADGTFVQIVKPRDANLSNTDLSERHSLVKGYADTSSTTESTDTQPDEGTS